MKILFSKYRLFTLLLITTVTSCGFHMSSQDSKQQPETVFPPLFSQWEGNYSGSVKVSYKDGQDSRDFPADLTIGRHSKDAVVTLNISYFKKRWSFTTKPLHFSSSSTSISSTSVNKGKTFSYEFNSTMNGNTLTGYLNIVLMNDRGNPTLQEKYSLDFTKLP